MTDEKKEKLIREMIPVIQGVLKTINNRLERQSLIRDPVARNLLTLDNLCTSLDALTAYGEIFVKYFGFDDKLCKDVNKTTENIKQSINELTEWVQHPTYTTEHPIGQKMMNKGQERLNSLE